jgi:hypothetical protein
MAHLDHGRTRETHEPVRDEILGIAPSRLQLVAHCGSGVHLLSTMNSARSAGKGTYTSNASDSDDGDQE